MSSFPVKSAFTPLPAFLCISVLCVGEDFGEERSFLPFAVSRDAALTLYILFLRNSRNLTVPQQALTMPLRRRYFKKKSLLQSRDLESATEVNEEEKETLQGQKSSI